MLGVLITDDCNLFMHSFIECVYALYRVCCECCREGLWSLHASLFNVMQDLPETLEGWQRLTWAVLITVMARILIKSLFTYPGALWSLSGALVCSSTAASLAGLCGYGLVNTDSCSSQPQPWPTWRVAPDMPLNTPTAGATVRNRSIPQGRKTSMSNQRESAPRVMFFRPSPQPLVNQPLPFTRLLARPSLLTPSHPFKLVRLVYNSTSNLWWGKPCARDKQCHRNPTRFPRQGMRPKGKG